MIALAAGLLLAAVTGAIVLRLTSAAPPAPTILSGPSSPTTSTDAVFTFEDSQPGVDFECSLDGGGFAACAGGTTYRGLGDGTHSFQVAARAGRSPLSPPATYAWVVDVAGGSFSISGGITGLLYPGGPALPLDLVLANPWGYDLRVLGVAIDVQGPNLLCQPSGNLVVTPLPSPVVVAAHSTRSLSQLGAPPPTVRMVDLAANQDACKGGTFTFTFTGHGVEAAAPG
ncbi:MAG TPA: hypothetical protein VGL20_07650 [Candidatus Dormibacteraeota bacterium]